MSRNLTLSLIFSVLFSAAALGISSAGFWFANLRSESRLDAVISIFDFKFYDDKPEQGTEDSFAFLTEIQISLVNVGNKSSALLAVRPVLTRRQEDCSKFKWTVLTEDYNGSYWLPPFRNISEKTPNQNLAAVVPPGEIILLDSKIKIEDRSLRVERGQRIFVCLQFRMLDFDGQLREHFVLMGHGTMKASTRNWYKSVKLI